MRAQARQNTPLTGNRVVVRYPFHPLCGLELEMIGLGNRARGTVTVITPSGSRLRIPPRMLEPESAHPLVLPRALLSACALLALAEFVEAFMSSEAGGILRSGSRSRKEETVAAASTARGRASRSGDNAADSRAADRAGAIDGGGHSSRISSSRRV